MAGGGGGGDGGGGDEIGKTCGDRCDCKTDQDTSRCPGAERPRAAVEPPSHGT